MNKIAAYEIALEMIETEKRAQYLVDTYGTCDGQMPAAYLHAFDGLEKEASIMANIGRLAGSVGKKVSGGLRGMGMQGASRGGVKVFGKDITGRQLGYGTMATGAGGLALGGGALAFGAGRMSNS